MNPIKVLILAFFGITGCQVKQLAGERPERITDPKGTIAFTSSRDGNMEIYTVNLETGKLARLTNHEKTDYHTSWSPDGRKLAFYSKRNGSNNIYIMSADGSEVAQITDDPADDVLPEISPKGQRILFTSNRNSKSRNVFLMNIDGSSLLQLTNNDLYEESASWSPDEKSILFTRQIYETVDTGRLANGEIFRMDLATGKETRLTHKKGFDSGARFSPDGKRIAFYGLENGIFDIYLMNADGSNLVNLTRDSTECYSPAWSADGQWLAYTAGNSKNYEIWIIHVATGTRKQITHSPGRDEKPAWY